MHHARTHAPALLFLHRGVRYGKRKAEDAFPETTIIHPKPAKERS